MDDVGGAEAEGKDRNFVTALARGLDVLRCFRPGEVQLTNTDLAERTGLPKPTVSRLTHTLCQLGYLVQDRHSGSYRLGVGVLHLGMGVLAGMDICDRAADVLRGLRSGTNPYITAALGEAHRAEVIYVAVSRSRENVSLSMHVGSRLPLFRSAIGRAILAGMSRADRSTAVQTVARDSGTGLAALEAEAEQAVEEFQLHGYCTGYGDWRADVNGIAVPVVSLGGSRVHGLNVGGPSFHVTREELEETYAPLLIQAGKALSLAP
ncbi:IclR family transcriptional regulator [Ruegeria marina]|uniref:Transcriptional regulator, IclR family n=1 Tax=Ruegeria marina TaxID=639004 RepID=A0A1G6IPS9_9RHOB|nr:IclR family transcriptional regulator [Ruegeria marina]SDC07756.1 transcriptional regulator, IclR family [Ruegeria marina]